MFTAYDFQHSQHHYLWNSPRSNDSTAVPDTGTSAFGLLHFKTGQLDGGRGPFQWLPPQKESSSPTAAPHFEESQRAFGHGHGVEPTFKDVSASAHKKFLIFDQSGDQVRLISRSFRSPYQDQIIMPMTPVDFHDLQGEAGQSQIMKPPPHTEHHVKSEGGDMREDTEEINALLYSDSFPGNDDDVDGEDDDLTSTGHSPFTIIGGIEMHEKVWELTEEVGSTDGSTKRHKLLDGGYKKSSLVDTADPLKLAKFCNDDNHVETNCAKGGDLNEEMDSNINTTQKRAKICKTLRILESIVPGAENKDPILIIDDAINYLISLREKAEALELGLPEVQCSRQQ
ncbi:transcription factor bHLH143 [Coffea arabica]|uniref:Transcription factor bHLH143 n=1 Tax=Coffea arabica TaxID=13443 RepID=A0A6P6WDX2_COFAR|nr:transcription factor bHLH143-like [Coffea arabica]XP_027112821.1 transcription factor bHLH143-like [Coffea arabica]